MVSTKVVAFRFGPRECPYGDEREVRDICRESEGCAAIVGSSEGCPSSKAIMWVTVTVQERERHKSAILTSTRSSGWLTICAVAAN